MARMKLHWSPKSPYVRKVMVCAHELGCVADIELVRSVAAMLKPNAAIMRDNPLSKIPTMVLADGFTLFDSAVICDYLNAIHGGALFPMAGRARWVAQRWAAFGDGLLDALILWRNEREREQPLAALLSAFELKTRASLVQLNDEAAALTEAPLSIGQVTIGCALGYLDYRFSDFGWRSQAPALAVWHQALMRRPSFVATEPADG